MVKHLFMVHGRSFKPKKATLKGNWERAAKAGLARDYGAVGADAFQALKKSFAYYGDLSNEFLCRRGGDYDEAADARDRTKCIKALEQYGRDDFLGAAGKKNYDGLPGKTPLWEFLADFAAGPASLFGVSEPLIGAVAPDMRHYWNQDSQFGSDVRWRLTEPLAKALEGGDDVMLISHSLGTIVAFDVLWKFSYYGEYKKLRDKNNKLTLLVTTGSPLGDPTVRDNLKGAGASGARRYPTWIGRWVNVAAEDDYISHDETVSDDFEEMRALGFVDELADKGIYNLAVRHKRSNPHHGAGYLIHPAVTDLLAGWLGVA